MDGQGEKARHTALGPDEWDGPSKKKSSYHFSRIMPSAKVPVIVYKV